ncbi:hypothetical protein GCM10023149_10100 [Mucilaginibacter gynuensis]|uniref:GH16 domain-containing protein n=1 Tax=Mucilaginibacter gynuensis TaxID=1302236 RepID=A0ABP8FZQ0_9SPHI
MKKNIRTSKLMIVATLLICFASCKKLVSQTPSDHGFISKPTVIKTTADVWTEIFRDDFNTLNTANWTVTNRVDYNSSYCTYNSANITIGSYDQTSCLVLTATKPGAANAYTSGHIKSVSTFKPPVNTKYWIRARIKLIAIDGTVYKSFKQTYGVWPAFWMTNETNWPVNGEIDIMEGYSKGGTEKYASNLFYGTAAGVNQLGNTCESPISSGDGWHNYDVFWINNAGVMTLVIQLDGVTQTTYTNSSNPNLNLQNFSAHNILFNLCVGGPPNDAIFNNANINVMSKTMMWVDWVSVSSSPL